MRMVGMLALVVVVGAGLAGCSRGGSSAAPKEAARTTAPPPANSPLAKVQVGMSEREVEKLIGPPTSQNAYVTGKAFIPYYYGPDQGRVGYFYKGMGRVVFQSSGGFSRTLTVQRVEYDPNEPGHAR